jgi:sodium-dependent dicarboxylate transporter 2/3/5
MWMSNIAAAALMLGAMRPIWSARGADARLRGAMLLAVALAADLGGIATPIGSGPNGIAMAAVSEHRRITFLDWMLFGLPLAAGLTLAAVGLVWLRFRPAAQLGLDPSPPPAEAREAGTGGRAARVLLAVVCGVTVLLWLTEAAHGIASAAVAAGTVVALFATGLLRPRNALDLDWSTMLLIAGGIGLGGLLDASGIVARLAGAVPLADLPAPVRLFSLALVAAALASVMSNTGSAALLIPLAGSVDPSPSAAVIVAVAASFGIPFGISTPPNAMAVAAGLRTQDLLVPGLVILVGGCALVALTGQAVLRTFGVP